MAKGDKTTEHRDSNTSNAQAHPAVLMSERGTGDYRLAFAYTGAGARRLLYIHGSYSASTTGVPLVQTLGRQAQVWAPDLPGHGHSGPFTEEASISNAVLALAEFVRGQCKGSVDAVVGHSLGGVIAMALAAEHPGLCGAVVLISSPADATHLPLWAKALKSGKAATLMSWLMWASARLARLSTVGLSNRKYRAWKMIAEGADRADRKATVALFRSAAQLDSESLALRLNGCPVLILGATQDRIVRPYHALELHRLIPHSQLRWLSGGDHLSPYNDSERVSRYVFAFLKRAQYP
ncbi:MAG: alpha/beta hydrolase [Armatimonadetes bacterium]|nr:alpha/beta hydrolase [Armatimonadota bacterium]